MSSRDWRKLGDLVDFVNNTSLSEDLYGDYVRDPREHLSLELKIEQISEEVVSRIDNNIVADFDYSDQSLESIENMIEEGFQDAEDDFDDDLIEEMVMDLGSYLGLTLINSLGGRWHFRADFINSSIYFPSVEAECFPFHRVAKRLVYGKGDSLPDFYLSLLEVLGVAD